MRLLAAGALATALLLTTASQRGRPPPWVLGVAVICSALAAIAAARLPLGALLVLGAVLVAGWVGRRWRTSEREVARRRDAVIELCDGLAADLRAGLTPSAALAAASGEWTELAPAAGAARLDGEVAGLLRSLADRRGAGALRFVAAGWTVSARSGAGLAQTVERLGQGLRAERETARVVDAELASVRATARLLVVLPAGVLVLRRGIGGDPIGFLLDSVPGLCCLLAGLFLVGAGLVWVEAIASRARR